MFLLNVKIGLFSLGYQPKCGECEGLSDFKNGGAFRILRVSTGHVTTLILIHSANIYKGAGVVIENMTAKDFLYPS